MKRSQKQLLTIGLLASLTFTARAEAGPSEALSARTTNKRPPPIIPPVPPVKDRAAVTQPCTGLNLPKRGGKAPFAPGEELAYELSVAGLYVGRFETKVGKPRQVDGKPWVSLFGRARTNAFASSFKRFAGRYQSLAEPSSMYPMGVRVEATYGEDPRWEKVDFSDGQTKAKIGFLYQGREGSRTYDQTHALSDILTMLYHARTLELTPGSEVCQEVFGARWLWRLNAKVIGDDEVETPVGKKAATRVTTRFSRSPHPDVKPGQPGFEMDVYFAKDHTQAPLAFVIRYDKIKAEGRLVRWALEDRGEGDWGF